MPDGDHIGLDHKRFVAGDAMASADLRKLLDRRHRAADLQIAAMDGEAHQDADGNAKFGDIERGMVAGDDACIFKPVDALGDRRCREANLPANLCKRHSGILLQRVQDLPGNSIELEDYWERSGAA